ncbi:FAD:protein FMN transferase [Candidatus Woesearchaeota archaeon]|nr:FAD:protein FMN transferase [Candidatus Woesearchaeota archaeon]
MQETSLQKPLFGAEIFISVYDLQEEKARQILDEAYLEALRLEKIFNFYDPNSELSILNAQRKKQVSKELLEVLKKAVAFSKATNGEYDISLGKNFSRRKNKEHLLPIHCSYKDIEIKEREVMLNNSDVLIDLGSIAKGYIADKVIEFLEKNGVRECFVDARGDMRVLGDYAHAIEVQHPRNAEEKVCTIQLRNNAVATSGDYRQYDGNFSKSHILNQKEIASLTVIAPTLADADVYATALFVCGEKEREKLMEKNKEIGVLIIQKNGQMQKYNGFEERVQGEEHEI